MDHDPAPFAGQPPSYPPAGGPAEGGGPPLPPPLAGFVSPLTLRTPPLAEFAEPPSPPPLPPPPPRGRRVALPTYLFLATCLTTFWAGTPGWSNPLLLFFPRAVGEIVFLYWRDGLVYMTAVMSILLAHEMGHFLQAVRFRVPASLPFFIPMPLSPMGTMGAVIGMRGLQANRRELFDIGLSGPWAGLIVAIPISWVGIATAEPSVMIGDPPPGQMAYIFQDPLLFKLMIKWLHGDLLPGQELQLNPLLQAGWVGMLVTGLNMLPISQLDGGHVAYAILGRRAHWLARGVALIAAVYILVTQQFGWSLMLLLVLLIGVNHPPTSDDRVPLGWFRIMIGLLSLIIPILCLAPNPLTTIGG